MVLIQLVNGLMEGMTLFLIASGLTLIFGVTRMDLPGFSGERLSHFLGLSLECDGALEAAVEAVLQQAHEAQSCRLA